MIQTIKDLVEEYRHQFYTTGNPDILHKLCCIVDIVRRMDIKKEISLLDFLNIKREIEGLMKTINGYINEQSENI